MAKLETIFMEQLRDAPKSVANAKVAKRLVVALGYTDGESVTRLSEQYDIPRSTLYY